MRILLQGTGAADGIPAFFDDSRVSRHALANGGKDIRTRSAALIDGHLKLDFGPDTFSQAIRDRISPRDWSAVIFTHTHDDHFCRAELQYMLHSFTPHFFAPIPFYGNETIVAKLIERYPEWPFEIIATHSFEPFQEGDYKVTPIAAFHKLDEDCHNLIIQDGNSTFLYGTDTGYWREPTWEFLSDYRLDGMVIESTDGFVRSGYHGHMDCALVIQTTDRLREMGVLADKTPVVTTHHCHLGDATHAELEAHFAPHGITPGFDGMIIDLP